MRFVRLLLLLVLCHFAATVCAQEQRALRLVVPVPAGGNLDTLARVIAQRLHARGTPALVDNRPGANTLIGSELVAHAPADGNTLLLGSTALAIAPYLQKTTFDPGSLVPVIEVSTESFGLIVRKDGPIDSTAALARAAAGRTQGINCVSVPGAPEIACEQLKGFLNGRAATIPYPGLAPATTALLGGHGDVMFSPMATALPLLRGGQARLIAASARGGLPEGWESVPLLSEIWPGFVLEGFTGVFAPKGTPQERILQLNRELDAILRDGEVRAAMSSVGQAPVGGGPQVLAQHLLAAQRRYAEVISRLRLGPGGP